ncbi:hypothetical protein BO86DRAFT_457740 [Aspergillus japonicus CBS 114.51]|uniref:Uncharacterized protein n=1 Tax=Aspergillus japonicus CBS 114.51 TaxID=1448312 RepID=A0A8T8WUT4_ASPJA|nr:hypothetical protein BO86DRAFT_457740 [Aspergillus japonicus CBS 114.51]RAH79543.1 hypothetical protein BO86DRAFT_457740 [Aspergillus japonicus CBS 114.51]
MVSLHAPTASYSTFLRQQIQVTQPSDKSNYCQAKKAFNLTNSLGVCFSTCEMGPPSAFPTDNNPMSTILYLVTELDACDATDEGLVDAITSAFKADMFPAQKQAGAFTTDELEWLAKKSYNLAMRLRNSERTEQTLSLLEVSIKKTHYTAAHESSIAFQANLTAHIQLPYNPESTPSPTSNLPQNAIPTVNASSDSDSNTLWLPKYRIILALDLEASIHLNSDDNTTSSSSNWTHIANLIHLSSPILTPQVTAIYLDILLRASTTTPLSNIVQAIKLLLRTIHTSPSPDLTKPTTTFHTTLPRYLHVLYQLALDASQPELAESVLDQVLVLVRDWKMTEFPEGEVQWMASVAFNRAVDFYLAGEDGECRRWAGKAIALADLLLLVVGGEDGGGALGRLLRARYGKLMVEGGLEGPGSMGG